MMYLLLGDGRIRKAVATVKTSGGDH